LISSAVAIPFYRSGEKNFRERFPAFREAIIVCRLKQIVVDA
jgi:hypothetical protein